MTSELSLPPSADEITTQLELMLGTPRFRTARSQAEILRYVVNAALKKEKTSEDRIGYALFPAYKVDESTNVRVTVGNLRMSLKRYYDQEGSDDLVTISLPDPPTDKSVKLPRGEAYRPTFSFNPRHAANKEYRLGKVFADRGHAPDFKAALEHFIRATKLYPDHVEAHIAAGQVLLDSYLFFDEDVRPKHALNTAELIVNRVLQLAPEFWGSHLLAARLFWVQQEESVSEQAFQNAHFHDAAKTEEAFSYWGYLCVVGREEEAISLAKRYADVHLDEPRALAAYASILYRLKRLREAESVLDSALRLDRNCFYAQYQLAMIYLDTGRTEEAKALTDRFHATLDSATHSVLLQNLSGEEDL